MAAINNSKPGSSKSRGRSSKARAAESSAEEEEEDRPSRAHKARKLRARESELETDEDQAEGEERPRSDDDDRRSEIVDEKPALRKDVDGYVQGSIVRIKCQAFVTYDAVEFRPGPALNMILGPNGTGKSTIACAIAIGLGFPAKVLGRATRLSEFCKKDSTKPTWVEIELKAPPGARNLVVRRNLSRDNEGTSFSINGDDVTAREVTERMSDLGVQIGNLCTFLPQDRVAAFSQMSSVELLKETEMAAGDEHLSHWHELLIEEYQKQKRLQSENDQFGELLKRKEAKQAENEKEVRQFEEREKVEHELNVINLLINYANYNDKFAKWNEAKAARNQAEQELLQLEAENRPFRDSQNALKDAIKDYTKLGQMAHDRNRKLIKKIKESGAAVDQASKELERTKETLDNLRNNDKTSKENIARFEKDLMKLERELAKPVEELDFTQINAAILEKRNGISAITERKDEIATEKDGARRDLNQATRDAATVEQRLRALDSVKDQREVALKQFEPDTWEAVKWLRTNIEKFKGKVHEPPRLSLFVKKEHAGLVDLAEAPIPLHAFKTFLFEDREDYDFMMREINDKVHLNGRRLRINGQQISPNYTRERFPPGYTPEQLESMGFDCLATDLLEGPEAVLTWLSKDLGLGQYPVQVRTREWNMPEMHRLRVRRWYTPEGSNSVTVSKYGRKESQTEQRRINAAKVLKGTHDAARAEEYNNRLSEANARKDDAMKRIAGVDQRIAELDRQQQVIEDERTGLLEEKEKMASVKKQRARMAAKRQQTIDSLKREKAKPTTEEKRERLRAKMVDQVEKHLAAVSKHNHWTMKMVDSQVAAAGIVIRQMHAENDLKAMDHSGRDQDQALTEKQAEVDQLKAEVKELFKEAKKINAEADEAFAAAPESVNQDATEARSRGDLDLEQLITRHAEADARLNVTVAISPEIVRRYKEGKAEVTRMRATFEDSQASLSESTDKLEQLHEIWLPALESLVERICTGFRAAFDNLGLLGEVRLAKDDDYAKWGIEILVSFRDNEPLKALTSHRQSGGERALTTVMYLMSLAELAKAPFALVDEINQGMDQRVERQVHNALVRTTSKPDVGQYFLLTPKLLPDLQYDPTMKVLIINSGPWLPSADSKLSLRDLVKSRSRRNAQRAS